jgi:hypothetical protein
VRSGDAVTETQSKLCYDQDGVLSKESVVFIFFECYGALWSGFSPRYDQDGVLSKESVVFIFFECYGALWSGFSPRLRGENAAQ